MPKFSDRMGITRPLTEIQVNSMDAELRNSLWNLLAENLTHYSFWSSVVRFLFIYYFKQRIDDMPSTAECREWLQEKFIQMEWFDVYNVIELVLQNIEMFTDHSISKSDFESHLNYFLERELSGYRAIEGELVPITNEQEIEAIRQAVSTSSTFGLNGVWEHITKALELIGKKPKPDYSNSIKESISAVESICRRLTGEKDFGKALNKLSQKISLHSALKSGFSSIYGYTSDKDGIRHAILEQIDIDFAEAKFMLVSCSAFVNFIIDKARQVKML